MLCLALYNFAAQNKNASKDPNPCFPLCVI